MGTNFSGGRVEVNHRINDSGTPSDVGKVLGSPDDGLRRSEACSI